MVIVSRAQFGTRADRQFLLSWFMVFVSFLSICFVRFFNCMPYGVSVYFQRYLHCLCLARSPWIHWPFAYVMSIIICLMWVFWIYQLPSVRCRIVIQSYYLFPMFSHCGVTWFTPMDLSRAFWRLLGIDVRWHLSTFEALLAQLPSMLYFSRCFTYLSCRAQCIIFVVNWYGGPCFFFQVVSDFRFCTHYPILTLSSSASSTLPT